MSVTTEHEVPFPSVAWFEELARCMGECRDEFRKIGEADFVMGVSLIDGAPGGGQWAVRVDFEEFGVSAVKEISPEELDTLDFALETDVDTWREMVVNIVEGGGKPDLDHTLNRLSLPGTPIRVRYSDPLGRDMFFRFNQTVQRFINNCARFRTRYGED